VTGCSRVRSVWVRAYPGLRLPCVCCVVACAAARVVLVSGPPTLRLSASLPANGGGDLEIKYHPGPRNLSPRLHLH
jgi:hypothetical protein